MRASLDTFLASLALGDAQLHGHLAVFPLLAPVARDPDYVTLTEALERGLARVTEVSEHGSVQELLLDNPSDFRILLLDGDELVGARQNRVLNASILVGPRTRTRIPVSCVERGRWSYVSRDFASEDRMMFARARAEKMAQVSQSLREGGTRRSDQGAVWDAVARKEAALAASSPTGAMRDVFAHADEGLSAYRRAFHPAPLQVGAVFALDGHAVGLEVFDAPSTFGAALGKLVASYALDALERPGQPRGVVSAEPARDLLRRARALRAEEVPAAGEGRELRLEGPGLAGSALVAGGRVVHLSVLEHLSAGGEEPRARGRTAA